MTMRLVKDLRKAKRQFRQAFGYESEGMGEAIAELEMLETNSRAREKEANAKRFLQYYMPTFEDVLPPFTSHKILQLPDLRMTMLMLYEDNGRFTVSQVAKCSPNDIFSPVVGRAICVARYLRKSTRKFE